MSGTEEQCKPPKDERKARISDDAIYAAVAARRAGFDHMVWQVPIISLTAQAFLFTIALGPDTAMLARCLSSGLGFVVAVLSMILMARHRQADIADAAWLEGLEANRRSRRKLRAHGEPWRRRRNDTDVHPGHPASPLNLAKRAPAFLIWEFGLALFGAASVAIFVIALSAPESLSGTP